MQTVHERIVTPKDGVRNKFPRLPNLLSLILLDFMMVSFNCDGPIRISVDILLKRTQCNSIAILIKTRSKPMEEDSTIYGGSLYQSCFDRGAAPWLPEADPGHTNRYDNPSTSEQQDFISHNPT